MTYKEKCLKHVHANNLLEMVYNSIGVIVCSQIGANIAGIVFSDAEEPLYILPKDLFEIDENEKKSMTKTQILRREKIPSVGENLEFNADNTGLIVDWTVSSLYREIFYGRHGVLQVFLSVN